MVIDNSKLIKDPASRIELKDKLLVVIQELPQVWNEFDHIKRITGDKEISERGNFRNLTGIENTIKFFATVNNLPRIPTKDENAMFGRRLSLMTNTKKTPYPQNDTFEDEIIESEGDEILSYLANLTSKNPSYMNGLETKRLWKSLANPELEYIERHFRSANPDEVGEKIPLQTILKELKKQFPDQTITVDDIVDTCKEIGINVFARCLDNVIRIETRVKQEGLVV